MTCKRRGQKEKISKKIDAIEMGKEKYRNRVKVIMKKIV